MYAQRRDANEREIVDALHGLRAYVQQMDKSAGFDLLVGWRGVLYAIEVKNPAYRPKTKPVETMLTDAEMEVKLLFDAANVDYHIVFTVDDVLQVLGV